MKDEYFSIVSLILELSKYAITVQVSKEEKG